MSEHAPKLHTHPDAMAPVVGIGGVLSVKTQWPYYVPLLGGLANGLSAKERFLPIPDGGRSPLDEIYGQIEEQLGEIHERVEGPVMLFGHSLGGLIATQLTLDHPDKITSVDCYAGAQEGIRGFTFTGKILRQLVGNPAHAEDLLHESDLMTEHRKRIAAEWPADVPLRLTSPTYDDLIPPPQGLGLELPGGRQPERRIIVPRLPGMAFGIRAKTQHLENLTELHSILPAGHIDTVICPPVISTMRQDRREAATPSAELIVLPSSAREALAATSAAA